MLPRTKARRRALDVLYGADVLDADAEAILVESSGVPPFAAALVRGVVGAREEIDALIRRLAEHWEIERMPVVDRTILRIAIYELLHRPDVPAGAAINDAVTLAKLLSTPDSGRFVNGILGRVAREHRAS